MRNSSRLEYFYEYFLPFGSFLFAVMFYNNPHTHLEKTKLKPNQKRKTRETQT